MTRTPGPAPSAGVARYPLAVELLLGNSTISPMPLPPPRSAQREAEFVVVPRDHVLHVYPDDPALVHQRLDIDVHVLAGEVAVVAMEQIHRHGAERLGVLDDRALADELDTTQLLVLVAVLDHAR